MADSLSPPGGGKTGKIKRAARKAGKAARRAGKALGARFAAFKGSDLGKLALFTGEVVGAGALASAAKGYFGDRIKLWGKVDARLLAGVVAVGVGQYGIPGVMGKPKMGGDLINVGIGILGSWANDKAFELGANARPASADAPVVVADPAAAQAAGLVHIGSVDQVGLFKRRQEKIEARLERKLGKLKGKAEKKGIPWSDVRDEYAPRPAPVPMLAPRPFLRPRAWAARHPGAAGRWAAAHPRAARRMGL